MTARWLISVSVALLAACAPRNTAATNPEAVPTALVPPSGNTGFLQATGRGVQFMG